LGPSMPEPKVLWKYGMERIPEKSDPSYPLAHEHKNPIKTARYMWTDVRDQRLISLSLSAS